MNLSKFTKFCMLKNMTGESRRWRRMHLLGLDEPNTSEIFPVFVDSNEDSTLMEVSLLKNHNSDINSYVEVRVAQGHPLYDRLRSAIALINLGGDDERRPNIGQRIGPTSHVVEISEDEHKLLLNQ